MASFQSKTRWRRPRKIDNENYFSDPFLPTRPIIENSKKIATKFVKSNKYPYGFISSQNKLERLRKRENKNYRSVSFLPNA